MNWYKTIKSCNCTAAIGHCLDRIDKRLAPFSSELHQSVSMAEDLYGRYRKSFAVCIKELPSWDKSYENKEKDTSNGDWVIAVIRPTGNRSECITSMLRRSPNNTISPQPFTSSALRVDYVKTLPQFLSDIQNAYN